MTAPHKYESSSKKKQKKITLKEFKNVKSGVEIYIKIYHNVFNIVKFDVNKNFIILAQRDVAFAYNV